MAVELRAADWVDVQLRVHFVGDGDHAFLLVHACRQAQFRADADRRRDLQVGADPADGILDEARQVALGVRQDLTHQGHHLGFVWRTGVHQLQGLQHLLRFLLELVAEPALVDREELVGFPQWKGDEFRLPGRQYPVAVDP